MQTLHVFVQQTGNHQPTALAAQAKVVLALILLISHYHMMKDVLII